MGMEKILRSYRGRSEFVTDMVRSTIICKTVKGLQCTLEFVMKSANVHSIKNRFDMSYDGGLTGGYRDLNIQLSFSELEGTAFYGFVFELQIHLTAILQHK